MTHSIAESVFISDRVVGAVRQARAHRRDRDHRSRTPRNRRSRTSRRSSRSRPGCGQCSSRAPEGECTPGSCSAAVITGVGSCSARPGRSSSVSSTSQPFILLPPSKIVAELFERPRFYLEAAAVTGRHAVPGSPIALAIAPIIGSVLAASRFLEQARSPSSYSSSSRPWVAYFSSIVAWLGRGDPPVCSSSPSCHARVRVRRRRRPALGRPCAAARAARLGRRQPGRGAVEAAPARRRAVAACYCSLRHRRWPSPRRTTARAATCRTRASARSGAGPPTARTGQLWATVLATVLLGVAGLGIDHLLERVLLRWHVSQRSPLVADALTAGTIAAHGTPGWRSLQAAQVGVRWQSNRSTARTTDEPACPLTFPSRAAPFPAGVRQRQRHGRRDADPPTTPPAQTSATTAPPKTSRSQLASRSHRRGRCQPRRRHDHVPVGLRLRRRRRRSSRS